MPQNLPNKRLYTVKEVAKLLGFSTNTVYKYLDDGKITATRLGSEGRFRIPESEVAKLLQENQLAPVPVAAILPQAPEFSLSLIDSKEKASPNLFDWFVGFLSMGLGFSQFIFPAYSLQEMTAKFGVVLVTLHIFLFLGGLLLIFTDIFKLKGDRMHDVLHALLGALFFAIGITLLVINAVPDAVGYLPVAIIIFLTAYKKFGQKLRFIIYFNVLLFFLGLGVIFFPKTFLVTSIVAPTLLNLIIFSIIWVTAEVLLVLISIKVYRGSSIFIKLLGLLIAAFTLSYSVVAFTNGFWGRAIYCVILASFALIFPFSDHFEEFIIKSKREAILSLAWLFILFAIGSGVLYFIYVSFENYTLKELTNRLNTANDILTSFTQGNETKVLSAASDKDVVEVMRNQKNLDTTTADSELKEFYMSSDGSLRRMVLVGKDGVILDTYPYNPASEGLDISNRDYFIKTKTASGTSVTGITQPSSPGTTPAVLVGAPITDANGNFLGEVFGSTDIADLTAAISIVKFGQNGQFILADASKNYIVPPTSLQVLTKAPASDIVTKAVDGESGAIRGYSQSGELSFIAFRPTTKYDWGLVAEQPFGEVFKTLSITGFVVFLIFLTSGVGSIVLTINLQKKNNKKGT